MLLPPLRLVFAAYYLATFKVGFYLIGVDSLAIKLYIVGFNEELVSKLNGDCRYQYRNILKSETLN